MLTANITSLATPLQIAEAQRGLDRRANSAAALAWVDQATQIAALEFQNYVHTRREFSFETCKLNLGYDRAVAFEIQFQGAPELEAQSREALQQMNAILTALHKPALVAWPAESRSECDGCGAMVPASHIRGMGYFDSVNEFAVDGPSCCRKCRDVEDSEDSDWTPVDEALALPIYSQGDFWYFLLKRSSDAVQLASDYPCCDVVDLETERTLTANEAAHKLDDPRYGEFEKFGVAFPETLNHFVTDFCAGLYPQLEAK